CVIMAGGIGSRFWPVSKLSHPKQFIDILGTGKTLLQQTFERFEKICLKQNIFIVTSELYKELVVSQIPGIEESQVLCEPARRNTAPCVAYANYRIKKRNPHATIVVAPSDHIILKEDSFLDIIQSALAAAEKNPWLITLGIKPHRPDTGYGYIQFVESIPYPADLRMKRVKTFTEKPEIEMARFFLQSGEFLWNSGIFVWSLNSILDAFHLYLEEVDSIFRQGTAVYGTPGETEFIRKAYAICKSISIDYGIMEKAENVFVLASDFGWSDLGTWGSLYEQRPKDEQGNSVIGDQVMTYDTKNCVIHMPSDKLAVIQGLEDYIVVESEGILLICRKSDEQMIRQFVNDVRENKGEKYF
ncbi:MAG TPA: mannose-1-phosphate guanylyltransferase, partial [Bacteroidales bacterium]|nr:mannose-1-phosphate guanylyltransferase [Bacteroidales bacterium]